ncbi:hypothetical protein ACIF6L_26635 [Kitasatospora sp. NPDC086009]|uniref:hypothetical protein n=1 Tax=unclassified Kitasatospora TaxID=2633591 RepID=UPI0037C523BB
MVLFTAAELSVFLQGRVVSDDTYALIHELTLDAIMVEVGARLADPPQVGIKSAALAVAGRALTNPGGLRSASAGAVAETYRDGQDGITLTAAELRRVRRAVGMASGAGMLDIGPADPPPHIVLRCPL